MAIHKESRYYGLILSKNMELTAERYLICKNVPICRSGTQEYLGSELEGFPGYQASWGLDSSKRYSVLRPVEEVLHSDTMASFEGKTVVDTHPEFIGNVVTVDNDNEVNCGHIQSVKEGPMLGSKVTLQGDLIIKNPELIQKIRPENDPESGIRDVSCGYTLELKRLADGTIVMFNIRGNHIAVVPKGRAGSRIAIRDSAPPEIKTVKGSIMDLRKKIFGRGLKEVVAEATPEELEHISSTLAVDSKPKDEKEDKPAEDKKPAMDSRRQAAHDALDRCMDAMPSGMGADSFGKSVSVDALRNEVMKHCGKDEDMASDEKPEELKEESAKDEELEQEEKTAAEEKDETHAKDSEYAMEKIDDKGKSVLKAANDSVRGFVKTLKPIVASYMSIPRSRRSVDQQAMIDSYNSTVQTLNAAGGSPYRIFTKIKTPEGIPAVATDSTPKEVKSCTCFDGVPYRKGLTRHQETCMKEGK